MSSQQSTEESGAPASTITAPDQPPYRYTAALAARIEPGWQDRWEAEGTFEAPNPSGPWAEPEKVAGREEVTCWTCSRTRRGVGLHVGHPLGYIATDVYGRFKRMTGHNVLHALGYDAFGLPAEQYAVQTGQHPRDHHRGQHRHDAPPAASAGAGARPAAQRRDDRPGFYRWTQWIFLQIYNAWYDERGASRAGTIDELVRQLGVGRARRCPDGRRRGRSWSELERCAPCVDAHRLAYLVESPVNWCPGLGTVLANEEVTADGRSDRGNFPVFKRNLRQWMMRITAYADRLLDDLDRAGLARADQAACSATGSGAPRARACASRATGPAPIEVFTTRPDTLFGATFMVLAPEHPLVDLAGLRRLAGRHVADVVDRRQRPRRATPWRPTARQAELQDRPGAADRGPGEDRCLHRRATRPTRSTARRSRCSSPTTC